jgi:hypothetical protein
MEKYIPRRPLPRLTLNRHKLRIHAQDGARRRQHDDGPDIQLRIRPVVLLAHYDRRPDDRSRHDLCIAIAMYCLSAIRFRVRIKRPGGACCCWRWWWLWSLRAVPEGAVPEESFVPGGVAGGEGTAAQ